IGSKPKRQGSKQKRKDSEQKSKTPSVDEFADYEHHTDEDQHEQRNDISDEDDDNPTSSPVDNQHNDSLKRSLPTSPVSSKGSKGHKTGTNTPKSDRHADEKNVDNLHEQHSGTCIHCPHCKQMTEKKKEPSPGFYVKRPVHGDIIIKMDDYDDEAVREKIISEKRHYPGSYDYRPYLTIEETDEKDIRKKN
ncbi:unnamed protein product, partial [Rotaria sp. Silwood1]